jgi:hypothetical protein
VTATIHPGRPNLLMEHLQLGLGRSDSAPHDLPGFYLSLYVISWSREMGAGHVALVRHRPPHVTEQTPADRDGFDQILTDNPDLARRLRDQLRGAGYSRVDLSAEPRPATFIRGRLTDHRNVRYLVSSIGLEIDAHWEELGEPTFAYGPAPQQPERQQIWSVLFEAESASAAVDGRAVEGRIYPMEHWVPWLGRPLASAHIARGEIVVDLPNANA